MKFFWKIFFAFTALMTVAFSFFGIWMITQSFRSSLEKEIEEGNRENRMFQFAFEVNMNALSDNYKTEKIVKDLAESVVENLDKQEYSYKIYRGTQNLIYENSENRLEHQLMEQIGENTCVYQVLGSGESRYLIFVCKSVMGGRTYYLESSKDITDLYEERNSSYDQYRVIMLALIAATGIVIFIVSHFLTRSVVELSYTTRRFAEGDYDIRAEVKSEDEIGTLAQDFNLMADNLKQKMEELKDAARKQEDFTASFAHELKTPLTSIIGYADMLRTMDMSKEETMEAANYIYSQGKRLESLSFKLLELIVTKNQKYQFKPISPVDLVQEVEQVVAKSLEKKKITCHTAVEEGMIYGEHDLLISLFTNLVDNARKALQEGGDIWITGQMKEEGYEISVKDNGCGMPKEEIDKITEAFYMVDKSRSRKEGGAGLGMTLCSRIVEVHSAKWYIRSKEGEGTEIWVAFPEREVPDEK
ncbi:MAG: ATP-binding protein [Lachnospiraceae bacterium]